jgi:exosortase/archaeosortase family protein
MTWSRIRQRASRALQWSRQSDHHRILSLGLFVGVLYLPTYLQTIFNGLMKGSSDWLLCFGLAYLALDRLWQNRRMLAQHQPQPDERFIGHGLILAGAVFFAVAVPSVSLQAFAWMLVLLGIGYSHWGSALFKTQPLPVTFLIASAYPDLSYLANQVWRTMTPHKFLEIVSAQLGSQALQLFGQPAIADAEYIRLPAGAVEVGPGCNGFEMSFAIAGFSLLLGVFLKQPWFKILGLMAVGVALALIFNVPRIMLLTIASVYWGKASFEFWHGPIGGQIFSTILLTAYYYIAMAMIHRSSRPSNG